MSHKRVLEEDEGDYREASPPNSKRVKKHPGGNRSKHQHHQNAHIDATWGQKYVFSSHEHATTIPAGEESDFEDDADAMAYLMSVRSQATEIPHLLVAPKVQMGPQLPADFEATSADNDDAQLEEGEEIEEEDYHNQAEGQATGYYEDGAYFDLGYDDDQEEGETTENGADEATAMQEAYFAALMRSYTSLRHVLNTKPPRDASKRLPRTHLTHAAPFSRTSHTSTTWTKILTTLDPHPLQLALLSKDSVFLILRVLLGGQLLQRGRDIPERTSRWLWALLARMPEPGELTHWELGWIRDLGKRAVLLGRSMEEMEALREEVEEGLDEGGEEPAVDELVDDDAVQSPSRAEGSSPRPAEVPEEEKDEQEEEKEEEDVAMDLESSDEDESSPPDLEEVRRRLLAQLDHDEGDEEERDKEEALREAETRAKMNMRATINMVLTVTGDFYGQRDLLEFREPFGAM
ncbi:v-snare [Sarocladium implicatum]|nr:v-snare [Sarocladium implicatum]